MQEETKAIQAYHFIGLGEKRYYLMAVVHKFASGKHTIV